jgi:hypothetical protein
MVWCTGLLLESKRFTHFRRQERKTGAEKREVQGGDERFERERKMSFVERG